MNGTLYASKPKYCCPGGDAGFTFGLLNGNATALPTAYGAAQLVPSFVAPNVGGFGGGPMVVQSPTVVWFAQMGQVRD
jgi:hypothetical protein